MSSSTIDEKLKKLGPESVLDYDPKSDGTGTVTACMEAFKTYCKQHLKLSRSCDGPMSRTPASAYSHCAKDEDCKVYKASAKNPYKLTCDAETSKCKPSYNSLKDFKFFVTDSKASSTQDCSQMVIDQKGANKYKEVGDFNKMNRGRKSDDSGATAKRNRENDGKKYYLNVKLCKRNADEAPKKPICDILQAGGKDAGSVQAALKKSGITPFSFEPIPNYFSGNGGFTHANFETHFKYSGMFLCAGAPPLHCANEHFSPCAAPLAVAA